ncbi:MAG: DUF2065 domain-containing protein [Magnetococcales bacterium]|nr:DUF2065 domain-containing protein [Magnetococcales bacterium]
MSDLLTALGLMLIIEGTPYFLNPGLMRQWIMRVGLLSDSTLRQAGLFLMIVGLVLVYLVRKRILG